jgi:hypothetical protein
VDQLITQSPRHKPHATVNYSNPYSLNVTYRGGPFIDNDVQGTLLGTNTRSTSLNNLKLLSGRTNDYPMSFIT